VGDVDEQDLRIVHRMARVGGRGHGRVVLEDDRRQLALLVAEQVMTVHQPVPVRLVQDEIELERGHRIGGDLVHVRRPWERPAAAAIALGPARAHRQVPVHRNTGEVPEVAAVDVPGQDAHVGSLGSLARSGMLAE
jgi:hypothetical protein